ncbi:hypothetical protein [Salinibaculum salinum]|uniref:hypothetical protein n=1 Tax=Salinibaculum salinum TaxID=3131996 RepID=UPI0030EBFEAB
MAQIEAERAVLQSVTGDDNALSPEGSAKVQERRGTYYLALPLAKVQAHGLGQGAPLQRGYHPETGCVVVCLRDDVDLFEREF